MAQATERSSRNYDKGIPLCLPNNFTWDPSTQEVKKTGDVRRSLCPIPQAVEMLKKIKEPVCVVSIAGPCRAGKSYIIDEVFGQMEAFPVGHFTDPETTGIWMWISPQPFQDSRGRDFKVILLDSEGINAVSAKDKDDNRIFTLTVLLASVLIYNSMGVPKRTDLNDLDFIVKLSQQIRIKSEDDPRDKDLFRNTFPFFFWLLRDAVLKLPPDCDDINQFFSKRVFKGMANENQEKVAESILSYFPGFESFALPPPSVDPDIVQDISNNRDKLNPKFREGVKCFEILLKSKLVPKRSINKGEYVTGEALGELVGSYINAINDPNAIPNVTNAWDFYVKNKIADVKQDALKKYDQSMAKLTRLPCDGKKLLEDHDSSAKEATEKFMEETAELNCATLKDELMDLTKSFVEKLKLWKDKNAALTQTSCDDLLKKLKGELLDPVYKRVRGPNGAQVSYSEIIGAWSKIKDRFNSEAVGAKDVTADAFFKFSQTHLQDEMKQYEEILKKMKDYDMNISKERVAKEFREKELKRLEALLTEMTKKEQDRQKKMEMLEKRHQSELKVIRNQSRQDIDSLRKQIEIVKDAGMKVQKDLGAQLEGAIEREKETNEALRAMKLRYDQRDANFQAGFKAMMEEVREARIAATRSYEELLQQMSLTAETETHTISVLKDTVQLLEEHRKEAVTMRSDIQTLREQLEKAQNPGLISWVIRKIF